MHDVVQRSPEWAALRLGRVCSSHCAGMLAKIGGGKEAAGRRNLRVQLLLERLTGRPQERGYQSQAMLDGITREEHALALYEARTGRVVRTVGFVAHPSLLAGASPDGIVGDWERNVEVKSPIPATHLDYVKTGVVPDEYLKQMRHVAWLTNMRVADFVSFHPEFPEPLRLKIVTVKFTLDELRDHGRDVRWFLDEVDNELAVLRTITDLGTVLKESIA